MHPVRPFPGLTVPLVHPVRPFPGLTVPLVHPVRPFPGLTVPLVHPTRSSLGPSCKHGKKGEISPHALEQSRPFPGKFKSPHVNPHICYLKENPHNSILLPTCTCRYDSHTISISIGVLTMYTYKPPYKSTQLWW